MTDEVKAEAKSRTEAFIFIDRVLVEVLLLDFVQMRGALFLPTPKTRIYTFYVVLKILSSLARPVGTTETSSPGSICPDDGFQTVFYRHTCLWEQLD